MDYVITRGKYFFQIAFNSNSQVASKVIGFFIAKAINPNRISVVGLDNSWDTPIIDPDSQIPLDMDWR